MSKDKENLDWLDFSNVGTFDEVNVGPMYGTPDWVRHPERYPELMERMKEFGKLWTDGLKEKKI